MNQSAKTVAAVAVLSQGIKRAPRAKQLYCAVAEILFEAEQYHEALDIIDACPTNGVDAEKIILKGHCLERLNRLPEAEDIVDRIIAVDASSAAALNLKGILLYRRNAKQSAEVFFERAIRADATYGRAYTNLALLKLEKGPSHAALDLLEKGFRLAPHIKEVAEIFHEVMRAIGAFDQAETILRQACHRFPGNKRLSYFLIDTLIQQNKKREAMAAIEAAMAAYGIDDGILAPALKMCKALGPMKIDPQTRTPDTVSLCMIVQNEEDNLARCLASVKNIVNEIVVVDTGSSDRTQDIAKAFGANLYAFNWTHDFARARNFSLSKANGEWIFILDADEVVAPQDHEAILRITRQPHGGACAYSFVTRNYTDDTGIEGWQANDAGYQQEKAGSGWSPSAKVRLFPNDGRLCFENTVHELVEPSLRRAGMEIKKCAVPIHHYGTLDPRKALQKKAQYYSLGRKKLHQRPGDLQTLMECAVQANEVGAHEDAIHLWTEVLRHRPGLPKAYFNLSFAYIQLQQYAKGLEASRRAMDLDPHLKEAALNYALCHLRMGAIGDSVCVLEKMLRDTPRHPMAVGLLAVAYCINGENEKGLELFDQIRKMGFNCRDYIRDHAEKFIAAGRKHYAAVLLQTTANRFVADEDLRSVLGEPGNHQVATACLKIRF
ncbi:MAG: glycosyltransferase [Desulfobacterales bacterium]|nr:MAG: glycosyltransferase [Desulfobacterales bacterium]